MRYEYPDDLELCEEFKEIASSYARVLKYCVKTNCCKYRAEIARTHLRALHLEAIMKGTK